MNTFTTYDELAPSIIATLEAHDRDSAEARDAMETLSVLNTIRDSVAMGAPFARTGEVNVVASNGWLISRHDEVVDAALWLARQDRNDRSGLAIVEVDRTGDVDTYRIVPIPR